MATRSNSIYLDIFQAGLFTNRSPIRVPSSNANTPYAMAHPDALIDGSNVELSPRKTLIRRPGFPTYCSSAFGVSEWPLAYWGGRISSTLYNIVDTQTAIYTFSTSSKASIWAKTTTAKSYFQQSGSLLYISDGTVNNKWDGTNLTTAGLVAPTSAPAVANLNFHDIVGGIQTVHAWAPNYTYTGPASGISTIWLKDPNGNFQFAFLNPTQIAKSGNSSPTWSTTTGGRTTDGDLIWTNSGSAGTWAVSLPNFVTSFTASTIQNLFSGPSLSTSYSQSGSTAVWSGTLPGVLTCASASAVNSKLLALTAFGFAVPSGCTVTGVKFDFTRYGSDTTPANTGGNNKDVTIQLLKASVAAGSNKAASGVAWAATAPTTKTYGNTTDLWGTTLTDTDVNNAGFGIQIQIALTPGAGGSTHHAFITRAALTVYYTVGSISGAYTSTIIVDSNGNLQRVKTAGAVGGGAPTWSKVIGGTTADNTVTWECMGASNLLAAFVGWKYAYGFHTPTPHISTMSPTLSLFAPIIGTGVTLTGVGSDNTQVDTNDLYRTTDGGPLLLYCASDNNVNSSTSWSIFDNIQDVSLNSTLVGPIAHVNDPPPAGLTNITYYMGRQWGSVGSNLYFTAGPDCTNGNRDECWPPANVFPMPSNINSICGTSNGLLVALEDTIWGVLGGPQTLTFFTQVLLKKYGVLSSDCVASDGDSVYLLTSSRQIIQLSANGRDNLGYPIADILRTSFDPSISSITIHRNGDDNGLLISNGVDTTMFFSFNTETWSPKGTIAGGVGLVSSLETSTGTYTALTGRVSSSGNILGRSLSNFVDGSSTYAAFGTIGNLVLTPAGVQGIPVSSITLQYLNVGSDLTVGVLPNEVSGSFTDLPFSAVDPFRLPQGTTIKGRRHDWMGNQSALPNEVKHLQIKVAFPNENAANELLAVGIMEARV